MELQSEEVRPRTPRPVGSVAARAGLMLVVERAGPGRRGSAWSNPRATLSRQTTAYPSRACAPHRRCLPPLHLSQPRRARQPYSRGRALTRGDEPGRDYDRISGGDRLPGRHAAPWDGDG